MTNCSLLFQTAAFSSCVQYYHDQYITAQIPKNILYISHRYLQHLRTWEWKCVTFPLFCIFPFISKVSSWAQKGNNSLPIKSIWSSTICLFLLSVLEFLEVLQSILCMNPSIFPSGQNFTSYALQQECNTLFGWAAILHCALVVHVFLFFSSFERHRFVSW